MRFSITINHEKIKEAGISYEDAVIVDYLYWLCLSIDPRIEKERKEVDGIRYTWVDYSYALRSLPCLRGRTKSSFSRKVDGLLEKNMFLAHTDEVGRKYLYPTTKTLGLFEKTPRCKNATDPLQKRNIDKDNIDKLPKGSGKTPTPLEDSSPKEKGPAKLDKPAQKSPQVLVIEYFCSKVKEIHKINYSVNWKKDASVVSLFLQRENMEKPTLKKYIDTFIASDKFKEYPTITACFSSATLNAFKLKNKPTEEQELWGQTHGRR